MEQDVDQAPGEGVALSTQTLSDVHCDASATTARNTVVSQRQRLLTAMGDVVVERGRGGATVELVCKRAGMSRRTFYELFTDVEQCFIGAVGQAFARLLNAIDDSVAAAGEHWEERAVAAIVALLDTLERDPVMARLCLIEPLSGNRVALSLRNAAVHRVATVVTAGAVMEDEALRDVAARGAVGAVLQLAGDRLMEGGSLRDLAGPVVYTTMAPFIGRRTAASYAERVPEPAPFEPVVRPQPALGHGLMTELTRMTLLHLEQHPGSSNVDIARAVAVRHESQMSRHLHRLERAGVLRCRREGRINVWQLTALGQEAADQVRHRGEWVEPMAVDDSVEPDC